MYTPSDKSKKRNGGLLTISRLTKQRAVKEVHLIREYYGTGEGGDLSEFLDPSMMSFIIPQVASSEAEAEIEEVSSRSDHSLKIIEEVNFEVNNVPDGANAEGNQTSSCQELQYLLRVIMRKCLSLQVHLF